jgi:hypothetical protein
MSKTKGTVSNAMAGVRDAMGAVGIIAATYLVSAVKSAATMQEATDALTIKLKNTGIGAAGANTDINSFTDGVEKMSVYTKSDAVSALDTLITRHVSMSEALKDQSGITELAAAKNISLTDSANLIANAENGRWMGLEKLGIVTKEEVKNGISMATVNERLNSSYKGLSEGKMDSLPGQLEVMNRNWKEFTTDIGTALLPLISKVAGALSVASTALKNISEPTKEIIAKVLLAVAVFGTLVGGLGIMQRALSIITPVMTAVSTATAGLLLPIIAVIAGIALFTAAYTTNFGGFKTFVDGIIKQAIVIFDNLVTWFKVNWPTIQATFEDVVKAVMDAYNTYVKPVVDYMIITFERLVDWVKANWPLISDTIKIIINTIMQIITGAMNVLKPLWELAWNIIKDTIKPVWNLIQDIINTAITVVEDVIKLGMDLINGNWKAVWQDICKAAKDIFGGMGKIVGDIFDVIGGLFKGIATTALKWGSDLINNIINGIKQAGEDLKKGVGNLINDVITAFKKGFGINSPSTVMHDIGGHIIQGLINGLGGKDLKSFAVSLMGQLKGAFTGGASASVAGWLTEAMMLTGVDMSNLPALETIVMHESGGNPDAINLNDSNAAAGHPSQGLMQTIPSTFNAFKLPGYDGITNPVSNAIAGIRYILATYGSVSNVPGIKAMASGGNYIGYAAGTLNATKGMHMFGENGPELSWANGGEGVLNATNTQALLSIPGVLSNLTTAIKGIGGKGRSVIINGNVSLGNATDEKKFVQMQQFLSAM